MSTGIADSRTGGEPKPWMPLPQSAGQATPWLDSEAPHVVIVEDDAAIRDLLTLVLSKDGMQVRAVGSGREALIAVSGASAQVMVTDFQLPDMDGLEVLAQATQHDPRMVGIVMTGHGTVELAVKAMKAGAADLLTKPFSPDDMVRAVRRVLDMQQLRHEHRVVKHAMVRGLRIDPFQLGDVRSSGPGTRSAQPQAEAGARTGAQAGRESTQSPDYLRGLAEGERRLKEQAAQFAKRELIVADMAKQLATAIAELPVRMEAEVVRLAFEIARKVVQSCAERDRELVVTQARDALSRIADAKVVRILVHPSEVALMTELREQLTWSLDGPAAMRIDSDPTVAPGGCRVETPTHLVDATVDGQLARIAERFRQGASADAH